MEYTLDKDIIKMNFVINLLQLFIKLILVGCILSHSIAKTFFKKW